MTNDSSLKALADALRAEPNKLLFQSPDGSLVDPDHTKGGFKVRSSVTFVVGNPGEGTKNFSFRAECAADVERLQQACEKHGLAAVWTVHSDGISPDVEVDLKSMSSLKVLREVVREVVDGHVMLQTLRECPLAENSLEHDYNLH
ncbi:TPA: hypothetical protein VDB83_004932 [Burkholderia cenocepacia]|nr:hypothetical protein [Burkholderia cenocepacia]